MSDQQRPRKVERYMAKKNQMVRPATARKPSRKEGGQALVEYALIIALVVIAILGIVALTGPAVGNVFSNAVWNLLNQTVTPYNTLSPGELVSYLTAVASYTPPPRGQAATGTVAATFTKTNTYTPIFTYTPTFTKTATATATPSPTGPTGTPPDVQFNTNNVYKVNSLDEWHYDTMVTGGAQEPSRARILWNVDYFNNTTWTGGAVATDTLNDHLKFNWGAGVPRSGVNADNFSIRYTAKSFSDGLVTIPFTANEVWQIRVTGNQNLKVIIGGTTIVNLTMAGDTIGTKVAYYYSPTTTRQSVIVEVSDTTGDASAEVSINRVSDYGNCHWTSVSNDYRSQGVSMADSGETLGQSYRPNGSCTLRQRGWYDLTNTAAIPNPRLIFWNKWKLNTGDSLQVGVRKYDDPTDRWTWSRVQKAIGNNFNWNRQIVDLKSFPVSFDDAAADMPTGIGSQPATEPITAKDFTGHKVEIAFRVVSDASQENDGWYVDDIGVFNWNPPSQDFDYLDDIDNGTATNWVNECKWLVVNDTSSGTTRTAWSTGRYTSGSDCSLTLDKQLNVPTAAQDSNTPIMEFDAKTRLDSGDQVRVEWALPTADLMANASWRALPQIGNTTPNPCVSPVGAPATDYSIYCSTVNMAWETLRIDLSTLRGQTVMLRFRLYADTSGDAPSDAANPYGWSIDKVSIKTNNVNEVPIPFVEPFSTSSNWTLNGWALTSGSDPDRSAPTALTDSTGGTAYTSITNITTLLNPAVRIAGSTSPIVSFYTRWQAPTANLQLDFSTDDGFTWSPIWQFNRTTMGDENRAWERFEVKLVDALAAVGRTVATTPRVMFRFKMQATGSLTVGDGFYIDDFRVEEASTSTVTLNAGNNFTYTEQLATAPTVSSILAAPPQWNAGGDWAWQPTVGRNNGGGFTDSPLGVYNNPQRSNLEYASLINTSAAQFPALAFWTKYNMASGHSFAVDFKANNSTTWTQVWSNLDAAVATPTNLGWHRVVVPIDSALAQPIQVRFRLSAMDATTPTDGIYLDDIQFVDRAVWTDFNTTVPSFTVAIDQAKWRLIRPSGSKKATGKSPRRPRR
jgi:pilus assembly protein Flp/PilA